MFVIAIFVLSFSSTVMAQEGANPAGSSVQQAIEGLAPGSPEYYRAIVGSYFSQAETALANEKAKGGANKDAAEKVEGIITKGKEEYYKAFAKVQLEKTNPTVSGSKLPDRI